MASSEKCACIVGAGPAGCVCGRVLAEAGWRVELYERRPQLGGNCHDRHDEHGVLMHDYGPHYFRMSSEELLAWLSRFTAWLPGLYLVRAQVGDRLVPLPPSLATMAALKGVAWGPEAFRAYLDEQREPRDGDAANAQEQLLATVGRELFEALFRGYTQKQWSLPASALGPELAGRLPVRMNWDQRYVGERFQVMPRDGYTAMFERMVDHPSIHVQVGISLDASAVARERASHDALVYTGAVDELFGYRLGRLGYRSLRFELEHHDAPYVQPCVQINYPGPEPYTRVVELKHVTGQICDGTTICREYPSAEGEPYYPIPTRANEERAQAYRALGEAEARGAHPLYLVGRLAEYRYLNMDQTMLRAMATATRMIEGQR